MARRTTEEEWYDIFNTWDVGDQALALRVLEQIHRISKQPNSGGSKCG